jgi:glutamyl-tRNA synthetase
MSSSVKTRFAPSPTGFMHVGGVRTALFAWLIAKQAGGTFVLRIEDTDQAREVEGSDKHIQKCLQWLGLEWAEGPVYQSQRLDLYKEYARKLIDAGRAYADPYTAEEVQQFREQAQKDKKPFLYRNHRPENPPVWDGTTPLRFKSDPKDYEWHDAVMGDMHAGRDAIDDFILIKSDGFPTYNFAHIVDDHDMGITHIIRGQEFVASTPNYLNLYEALGFDKPTFACVPPIMNEQGNKKLSKRDGAKDLLEYKAEGYLPEAMINFLASLGWNDGTTQEEFTVSELVEKFSLERIQKSGARFDERRLLWLNGAHIRKLTPEELFVHTQTYWPETAANHAEAYKKQILGLVQERLKFFAELPELTAFFFTDLPVNPKLISTHKQLKKLDTETLKNMLAATKAEIEQSDFTVDDLQNRLNALLTLTHSKPAVLFSLIRIAITQSPASPGLAETLHVLGKEKSLARLTQQIESL